MGGHDSQEQQRRPERHPPAQELGRAYRHPWPREVGKRLFPFSLTLSLSRARAFRSHGICTTILHPDLVIPLTNGANVPLGHRTQFLSLSRKLSLSRNLSLPVVLVFCCCIRPLSRIHCLSGAPLGRSLSAVLVCGSTRPLTRTHAVSAVHSLPPSLLSLSCMEMIYKTY